MRGYVRVLQWYGSIEHINELNDPLQHHGDAQSVDNLLGFFPVPIEQEMPDCPIGHVVLRVEDDGSLTKVRTNYDTSG